MINNIVQLLFIMVFLPFSHSLNTPDVLHESPAISCSKKLTQTYAVCIAVIREYKEKWKTVKTLCNKPEELHKTVHKIVLNAHNKTDESSSILGHKKNQSYQELPYLFFKKNLDTAKKTVMNQLEILNAKTSVEQSAITHHLQHGLTIIESLDALIITTPEYYQEQIKIASVNKQTPLMFQLLQTGIGFIAKN